MSRFSNQLIYCNACGKEQHKTIPGIGKDLASLFRRVFAGNANQILQWFT